MKSEFLFFPSEKKKKKKNSSWREGEKEEEGLEAAAGRPAPEPARGATPGAAASAPFPSSSSLFSEMAHTAAMKSSSYAVSSFDRSNREGTSLAWTICCVKNSWTCFFFIFYFL